MYRDSLNELKVGSQLIQVRVVSPDYVIGFEVMTCWW